MLLALGPVCPLFLILVQQWHWTVHCNVSLNIHTLCLKKTVQICFCQNFVSFTPVLIIFGRKMAKRLKLCEMHSFSTSPKSRHHTTVLNTDVPNCYRTLKVDICNKLSNDLVSVQQTKMQCMLCWATETEICRSETIKNFKIMP